MTPRLIMITATQMYGITPGQMTGPDRTRRYAWPRIAAMAASRKISRASLRQIGRVFHRDHAAVVYAGCRADFLAAHDPGFCALYTQLQQITKAEMRIYIIGPAADAPCRDTAAYNAIASRINRIPGWGVINPATVEIAIRWDRDFDQISERGQHTAQIRAAIRNILSCDAVVMLPGWQDSESAVLLHDIATRCGLRVYPAPGALPRINTEQKVA